MQRYQNSMKEKTITKEKLYANTYYNICPSHYFNVISKYFYRIFPRCH
jgi:hypothetical protein